MSQDDYDRYLDAFGASLSSSSSRRVRRPLLLGASGSLALAAVVAAIVLAVGGGAAGTRLDPVAQARAALAPEGRIVHMTVRTQVELGSRTPVRAPSVTETWSAVDPPRWRLRETLAGNGGELRNGKFRPLRGVRENGYGAGSQRIYTAQYDELFVQRGYTDDDPVAKPPSFLQLQDNDPAVGLRELLAQGKVRDTGEVRSAGRTVRRLVLVKRHGDGIAQRFVYDVDPETFAPVAGSITNTARKRSFESTFRFTVERYETFPDTPENAHLLKIATTPDTRVIVRSAAKLRADQTRLKAFLKTCRKSDPGDKVCKGAPPLPAYMAPKRRK